MGGIDTRRDQDPDGSVETTGGGPDRSQVLDSILRAEARSTLPTAEQIRLEGGPFSLDPNDKLVRLLNRLPR